jgi:N-acetylneuraminate synthase
VLNYPTSGTNANLGRIQALKEKFPGFEIGYSDHTKPADSDTTLLIARTLGAVTFEKHFTLDKSAKGNDHYHAYDESDVENILERIKLIDEMISYSEESFIDIQRGARAYARRGLYAAEDLAKGTMLTNENIISLRPIPEGGFSADLVEDLIGRKLLQDLSEGEPIRHGNI